MSAKVTYADGVAVITTKTRKTEVHVGVTAESALDGTLGRPSATDVQALAAAYLAVDAERNDLLAELAAARAGKSGREHAQAMQGARKVIAELRKAAGDFLEVYDQGDAPDSDLDRALRDKASDAESWLVCDVHACLERDKLLKGGAA